MRILAVTACPVGIAHTYMAAENLQKAADELGVDMKVETQGSIGAENELTQKDIEEADGIIIASDKDISKDRFVGKKLLVAGVQEGIRNPEELIKRVQTGDVPVHGSELKSAGQVKKERKEKESPIYRHLMNGVSYMIPFIVVGGLLIAISLAIGGEQTPGGIVIPEDSFWKQIENIGNASFSFMVPILAGFIAVSIADRPGLVPGMIGGYIATTGSFYGSEAGAGFIGGIIAGFLAGYVVLGIKKIKVPQAVQPVMPIIFIPIIASLVVGALFIFVIGAPVAGIFESLTTWLEGMQGASSIVLALILGAMIAVDMGGPFNKVAFLFGSAMIAEGNYEIMGSIAVAICIPPLGMGLATFLNKRKYQPAEKETGKASFTMGLFGITEGAIPFAAQDPIRVIPSIMTGSMVGAVIAMITSVGDRVAHGGPIVAVLGAVDNVLMFFIATIIGTIVTALVVNLLKKDVTSAATPEGIEVAANEYGVAADSSEQTDKGTRTYDDVHNGAGQEDPEDDVAINKLTDILNRDLMTMNVSGSTQEEVVDEFIEMLDADHCISSKETVKQAIFDREKESSTGLGMNIAIPHAKSAAVKKPAVVFGISQDGIDWKSLDGTDAKLIFMIAIPEERAGDDHLKVLQMLSRKLMDDSFREQLLYVETKKEAYELLDTIQ
ncbi:PTS system D-mannose-specific IIA component, Fru family (TC 4.A.2.1.6)/PTS system D-mannose-specific IIB component, Fru family (TC 4.A.2.1.6)/PTS system D-mannose-specific IIC component, Fru family (TC 4.A.2.1.6) [Lentibacillus halodurans]|uniref:PTS system D-mannose-specific IIA component, Fru family (TC 4.A.2.1.6)/PTS system D-mannose-specific IIB component, Fru family (TC 4.A.2.1.6)/PTS system D-mannose-specific IIC component, Fru family... n=1 Tax=Lentibacillus halodurans TaxID=237679 RepID=A0A1I0YF40_9BACI|nr:PTS fructose transporter subunit IIABC [Lentibacillus halodurans]SFB10988.1 PTS system D-mannose-specific IIA component, Fru family (TC 4.A.2.1.6)/PTS system D-mannose-specific IIB component, Fru family (TC 4.A.2.1.6)/PTS system D-mannose-specific IIC component, Fru family (TC 4.A.2.1.6) [Lentibacillus halodurans]